MKITYKEALESWNELAESDISIFNSINGDLERLKIEETEGYEIIEKFIRQHKPPTWEDVVKAWGELGYDINIDTDYYDFEAVKRITHMEYVISISNNDYIKVSINHTWKDSRQAPNYILFEENDAINLTIKYLQGQHKDSE